MQLGLVIVCILIGLLPTNRCLIETNFSYCISETSPPQILHSPSTASYEALLKSRIQNLRFASDDAPKPLLILTPFLPRHVQAAVVCSRKCGLALRTLSGGHDYEGLSYTSAAKPASPFITLDLLNFRSVAVEAGGGAAWVESGASLGELYYRVAEAGPGLGFPAGLCPTVGVGGHFSGGGFGTLLRRFGLAADQVVDARVVDAEGRLLDRDSMGEGLFWAIRGGGGSSFCVVLAWKVKLVPVPRVVTVFDFARRLDRNGTFLFHKWQYVSPKLDENVFLRVVVEESGDSMERPRTRSNSKSRLELRFNCVFLGGADKLVRTMEKRFPELGLTKKDCSEMSWIESMMYFSGYPRGSSIEVLIERTPQPKYLYKAKSDYVTKPMSMSALEKVWDWCLEEERPVLIMDPLGGKMDEIPESEIPFPHRKGNLYNIQYYVKWRDTESSKSHIEWIRKIYERMTPYVSNNPRASYLNYRDLDLGVHSVAAKGTSAYTQAMKWGLKYFKDNFRRLAIVKAEVDPFNFFRDEQSIPPLFLNQGTREIE